MGPCQERRTNRTTLSPTGPWIMASISSQRQCAPSAFMFTAGDPFSDTDLKTPAALALTPGAAPSARKP